ncbi:endo-1,3(4)-beta-glucanase [Planoprotostelium fungivorum]|uniref:Endo-1,3(4)-beta-glucanase n=1 Tax=Planoprotostelium fungivorum TaxID=1890364 RepID=A0A2P6MSK1_9EUKA|nr:endo-1,3(4)-beta-glucanase [Planoprotostelium fungivorum]
MTFGQHFTSSGCDQYQINTRSTLPTYPSLEKSISWPSECPLRPKDLESDMMMPSGRSLFFGRETEQASNTLAKMKLYLILVTTILATAAACGAGESNCGGGCYDPSQYSCDTDINGASVLCPLNYLACNGACYSPSSYHCADGKLAWGPQADASSSSSSSSSNSGSDDSGSSSNNSGGSNNSGSSSNNNCGVNPGPAPAPAPAPSTMRVPTTQSTPTPTALPACAYGSEQNWQGDNFFNQFDFYTAADPTHGFVQFVDQTTAQNEGLISVQNDQVYMGVDHSNVQWGGRSAVRLSSKASFTTGLLILDLDHMPGSVCGTWPAFWTVGSNWPYNGEIDIIEGVNNGETNQVTMHTNAGCSVSGWRNMTGSSVGSNCDVATTGNAGCGVTLNKANSYGTNFNNAGGGAYVMERSSDAIKVWFFPKGQYPSDLLSGNPNPCSWSAPDSVTSIGGNCPSSHFGPQNIIFDITFCGDWAGAVFASQCGGDCNTFVATNPSAFSDSYWLINSVRLLSRS